MKSNRHIMLATALGVVAGTIAVSIFGSPLPQGGDSLSGSFGGGGGGDDPSGGDGWNQPLEDGWTEFQPAGDTRIYHVSASGNDRNDGRSPERAFRTIARAYQAMRAGAPDWLLLKRGDQFDEAFPQWRKGGRSEREMMLIGTYGEGLRPIVNPGNTTAFRTHGADTINHLAIVGIEFVPLQYDHTSGVVGIHITCGGRNLLIEDCYIHHFSGGIVLYDVDRRHDLRDIRIRRSIVADNYATTSHSQGLYAAYTDNILVEECVFDHNGWNESIRGAEATIFNHNIYISNVVNGFTLRDSIIANASSHGVQARSGGDIFGNVFFNNPLSILLGGGQEPNAGGVQGTVRRNVVLHGGDIGDLPRGHGITLQNVRRGAVAHNIVAFDASRVHYGHAILLDGVGTHPDREVGVHNVNVTGNFVYDWRGGLKIKGDPGRDLSGLRVDGNVIQNHIAQQGLITHEEPIDTRELACSGNVYYSNRSQGQWFTIDRVNYDFDRWIAHSSDRDSEAEEVPTVDMSRTIGTYHEMIGGDSTVEGFLQALRSQRRGAWTAGYTAAMLRDYLSSGYARADPGGHGDI